MMRLLLPLLTAPLVLSACAAPEPVPTPPSAEGAAPTAGRSAAEPAVRADINASYLSDGLDPARLDAGFSSESRETFAAREAVTAALGLVPGDVIADVGAGTGIYLAPFSAAVGPEGAVIAIDIAPKLVAYIDARAAREGLGNVRAQLGGTADTGLAPGSVDHVFTANVYHHFERPLAMNRHLFGAIRPGGTYAVLDFRRDDGASDFVRRHVRQDMATLIEEAAAAGFVFDGERAVPGLEENYLVVFRRPEGPGSDG